MSAASTIPFFGRAYRVQVTTLAGETLTISNSAWEPEALRIRFDIQQQVGRARWFADVEIYNLNASTEQFVFSQGDTVSISAGYQYNFAADSALLFSGTVFQPFWERIDVVDYKITLRCILGVNEDIQNFVSFNQGAMSTQNQVIQRMMSQAHTPLQSEDIDSRALSQKTLPRGKVIFGSPANYIKQVSQDNGLLSWVSPNGVNIRNLDPGSSLTPDIVYAPPHITNIPGSQSTSGLTKQTLLGVPQQTQDGVAFRVLLDSDLKIGSIVKLDMSAIRQFARSIGQNSGFLDQDGTYVVASVRHVGDTRGNEWESAATAVTSNLFPILAAGGST